MTKGVYLDNNNIGFHIVLDHYKKEIFPLYQIRYKLALLGPEDMRAEAQTTKPKKFKLMKISGFPDFISEEIIIPPYKTNNMSIRRLILGKRPIGNYSAGEIIEISYIIDGKKGEKEIFVPRITKEEANSYYGKNGKPPYPWM